MNELISLQIGTSGLITLVPICIEISSFFFKILWHTDKLLNQC